MTRRFTRRQALKTSAILIGGAAITSPFAVRGAEALLAPHGGAHLVDAAGPLPWPAANDILTSTVVPTFPSATFDVTKSPYN
ncbi:MAG TPA: twin-arginine translocation signal domain-containing protein, partial [Ktedonobacterales bacterium]|nr:twin-arginine translocation signal domain-containing protein [Ktedonobacterales bacterium]